MLCLVYRRLNSIRSALHILLLSVFLLHKTIKKRLTFFIIPLNEISLISPSLLFISVKMRLILFFCWNKSKLKQTARRYQRIFRAERERELKIIWLFLYLAEHCISFPCMFCVHFKRIMMPRIFNFQHNFLVKTELVWILSLSVIIK